MHALGRQILVEFYDCDRDILTQGDAVRDLMMEATRQSGATIVTDTFHSFSPYGVSGVIVIAESHVAIHTWPEYGYAAVDIFTCGDTINPWTIQQHLEEGFQSKRVSSMEMRRGLFPDAVTHKPVGFDIGADPVLN